MSRDAVGTWLRRSSATLSGVGLVAGAAAIGIACAVRDHTDTCGEPADLPSLRAGAVALAGLAVGFVAIVVAAVGCGRSPEARTPWGWSLAVAVAGSVGSLGVLGWVFWTHFQICF